MYLQVFFVFFWQKAPKPPPQVRSEAGFNFHISTYLQGLTPTYNGPLHLLTFPTQLWATQRSIVLVQQPRLTSLSLSVDFFPSPSIALFPPPGTDLHKSDTGENVIQPSTSPPTHPSPYLSPKRTYEPTPQHLALPPTLPKTPSSSTARTNP